MINYPSQFSIQPFEAEVTECVVTNISSNGGSILSRTMLWGDDPITVSATSALSGFTQFPACGYGFVFTPKLISSNGLVDYPVPNSAIY